jgi:hypothetical protein
MQQREKQKMQPRPVRSAVEPDAAGVDIGATEIYIVSVRATHVWRLLLG